MATFALGAHAREVHRRNARVVEAAGGKNKSGRVYGSSPVELRGIPALGPNVAGAIAGTRPDVVVPRRCGVD